MNSLDMLIKKNLTLYNMGKIDTSDFDPSMLGQNPTPAPTQAPPKNVINQDIIDNEATVSQLIGGQPQKGNEAVTKGQTAADLLPEQNLPPKKKLPILPIALLALIIIGGGGFLMMKKQNELKAQQMLQAQEEEEARIAEEEESIRKEDEELLAQLEAEEKAEKEKEENNYGDLTQEQIDDLYSLGMSREQIKEAVVKNGATYEECKENLEKRIKLRYLQLQRDSYEDTENLYHWTPFGLWQTYPDDLSKETHKEYTQSCKYEKVPAYGMQTQLCIYLDVDNQYERYYFTVDPMIYNALKQSDFITVKYKYRYDSIMGQYWIYDMTINDTNAEERILAYQIEKDIGD